MSMYLKGPANACDGKNNLDLKSKCDDCIKEKLIVDIPIFLSILAVQILYHMDFQHISKMANFHAKGRMRKLANFLGYSKYFTKKLEVGTIKKASDDLINVVINFDEFVLDFDVRK